MRDFCLPDLGEGLTSAEIVDWLVDEGDAVELNQHVVEVETEKSRVELPIPFSGVVAQLHGVIGTKLTVGQPLVTVAATDGAEGDTESRRARYPDARIAGAGVETTDDPTSCSGLNNVLDNRVRVASPRLRRLAAVNGIDLRKLVGTGPDGLIIERDVELELSKRSIAVGFDGEPTTSTDLRASKYLRSRQEIPEATIWLEVDATSLVEWNERMASSAESAGSIFSLIAKFAVHALRDYPELNARIVNGEIVRSERVNLGIATQTSRGVLVPVVKDADRLTGADLHRAIDSACTSAREGELLDGLYSSGTFTINDYGRLKVDGAVAIINYPEISILGIGSLRRRLRVIGDSIAIRSVADLTLSFDHRACDGEVAAGFLNSIRRSVESVTEDSFKHVGQMSPDLLARRLNDSSEAAAVETILQLLSQDTFLNDASFNPLASFKDLGLNSRESIRIRNRLCEITGKRIPVTALFDHPTPQEVAEYVVRLVRGNSGALETSSDGRDTIHESMLSVEDPGSLVDMKAKLGELTQLARPSADGSSITIDVLKSMTDDEVVALLSKEFGIH